MTIDHFAGGQNIVFVPALLFLLLATAAVCAPVVAAPGLRKARRMRPAVVLAALVAVLALAGTAVEAGAAFRQLGAERASLRTQLNGGYDLDLTGGEVGELVDGGKVERTMPSRAAALGLMKPQKEHTLKLVPTSKDSDVYDLTFGGVALPKV